MIPDDAELKAEFRPDLLDGVMTITGQAGLTKRTLDGKILPSGKKPFTAIPYYAWAHRGRGQMTVWPARTPQASKPAPADTLTFISKTTASFVHASLEAVKDQSIPANSADSSNRQLDFWPHKNVTEWLKFEWPEQHELSSVKVYWFDDTGRGGCKVPESWKVLYKNSEGQFTPVTTQDNYGVEKDKFNKVTFEPVKTSAIKIDIKLMKDFASGVQEVVIE